VNISQHKPQTVHFNIKNVFGSKLLSSFTMLAMYFFDAIIQCMMKEIART